MANVGKHRFKAAQLSASLPVKNALCSRGRQGPGRKELFSLRSANPESSGFSGRGVAALLLVLRRIHSHRPSIRHFRPPNPRLLF